KTEADREPAAPIGSRAQGLGQGDPRFDLAAWHVARQIRAELLDIGDRLLVLLLCGLRHLLYAEFDQADHFAEPLADRLLRNAALKDGDALGEFLITGAVALDPVVQFGREYEFGARRADLFEIFARDQKDGFPGIGREDLGFGLTKHRSPRHAR